MSDVREPDDIGEDDDLVAAEYVLGVLDADARRRVERRARREAVLQRRIEDWEHRLAPMLVGEALGQEPPAGTWAAVDAQLDRMLRFRAPQATPPVREAAAARFWKWFGLGSSGLLAVSLAALFVLARPPAAGPPLAAVIAPEGGAAIYTAVFDPRSARATLVPVADGAGAAFSNQLWLIGSDGNPRSLGLLPAQGPAEVAVSPELLAGEAKTLAISREPPGGSPTGNPTGPVIGTGRIRGL